MCESWLWICRVAVVGLSILQDACLLYLSRMDGASIKQQKSVGTNKHCTVILLWCSGKTPNTIRRTFRGMGPWETIKQRMYKLMLNWLNPVYFILLSRIPQNAGKFKNWTNNCTVQGFHTERCPKLLVTCNIKFSIRSAFDRMYSRCSLKDNLLSNITPRSIIKLEALSLHLFRLHWSNISLYKIDNFLIENSQCHIFIFETR